MTGSVRRLMSANVCKLQKDISVELTSMSQYADFITLSLCYCYTTF